MANIEILKSVKQDAKDRGINKYQGHLITDELRNMAVDYAMFYEGEFPFMVDISKKVRDNTTLTDPQIVGVLNTILREARDLPKEDGNTFVLAIPTAGEAILVEEKDIIPTTEPNLAKVVNVNTGDSYVVEDHTGYPSDFDDTATTDLQNIESQMQALTQKIQEIESSDSIAELKNIIKKGEQEEKELFAAFEIAVQEMREKRKAEQIQMLQLQAEINKAKQDIEMLALEHDKALALVAANQKLAEIEERLQKIRENAPWKDQIMGYQWEDVCAIIAAFLDGKNGVLNANDMGLGKTAESAFVIYILKTLFPERYGYDPKILWLTKKSLISSSIKEVRKWDADTVMIPVSGNPNQRKFVVELALANNAPVIVNYDALNTTPILKETTWDIVVMDEVHKLKGGANSNPTKVWENSVEVSQRAKFIMPLSGSPIQNHPKEMWAYLYMLEPDRFPDVKDFTSRFCWGYDEGLTVNWDRLIKILSNRVIRRSKKEVLKDLPDKTREFRYVEMTAAQRKIYDSLRDEFFVWLDEQKTEALTTTSILAQLTRLRQVAIMPGSIKIGKGLDAKTIDCNESAKIDEAMDIVDQLVNTGEQVVIFSSQFNGPLFELQRRIENEFKVKVESITGENSGKTEPIEERFANRETQVLVVNMKSGGEGLNLQTSCSHAIFLDLWWNPKANEQAEDRLHRKGQKNAVTIHILQAEDSVDAFIAGILEKKEAMIEGVMESDSLRGGKDWKSFLQEVL